MALDEFLDAVDAHSLSLSVINRAAPRPVMRMLETTFEDQPVRVDDVDVPDADDDQVVLVDSTRAAGSSVVATSTLDELMNAILLVNSDLYITGQTDLEAFDLPSVLTHLDDVPFSLRGYPESDKEKLVLIAISRYIERRAWAAGSGRLRSSFQRLSRLNDERGTRAVYEKIAASGVQTHLYGIPDWTPPVGFDVRTHGGYDADYRDSWFVVYTPDDDGAVETEGPVALLALETEPRLWEGYWTFRPSLVSDIDGYIARNM